MPHSGGGFDNLTPPADRISRWLLLWIFFRCLFIQSTWNPERMVHHGFLFALLPGFRKIAPSPELFQALIARHIHFFNTHPIMASFICGGVLRLEEQRLLNGEGSEKTVDKFKTRLSHLLGSVGDQFFWQSLRPVAAVTGVVLIFLGAPVVIIVGVPLVIYNIPHLYFRWFGLHAGYHNGLAVLHDIRVERFESWMRILTGAGLCLVGILIVLGLRNFTAQGKEAVIAFVGAGLAALLLQRLRVQPVFAILIPIATAVATGYWLVPDIM